MRDAMGGTVTLFIISVFIVLALGYLAFNVNYTKAFRMKDKIISVYEKNKGNCSTGTCIEEIKKYSTKIGYKPSNINCPEGYTEKPGSGGAIYCIKGVKANPTNSYAVKDRKTKCYYRVITKIEITIPIIDNLLDIDVFKVKGDTRALEVETENCGVGDI